MTWLLRSDVQAYCVGARDRGMIVCGVDEAPEILRGWGF
jgi:hypothetical protein